MASLLGIVAVVLIVTGLLALHRYAGSLVGRPLSRTREAHAGTTHVDTH